MARRGGLERFVMSMAKEAARQQRLSVAEKQRQIREAERQQKEAIRDAERSRRLAATMQRDVERFAKQQHLERRDAEAKSKSEEVAEIIRGLSTLLTDTLSIDDTIDFDSLRVSQTVPKFEIPSSLTRPLDPPKLDKYLSEVIAPRGLSSLFPGSKRKHAAALAEAELRYRAAVNGWEASEANRAKKIEEAKLDYATKSKLFRDKVFQRDAEVDAFRDDYLSGDPDAIVAYCSMVLERSVYPDDFPQNFSVAYTAASRQLVIEYELPSPAVVPSDVEYKYVRARDIIEARARKPSEIKEIYQDIVASIALRTIHEVLEADQAGVIDVCCLNGYVHTIDPATGRDVSRI